MNSSTADIKSTVMCTDLKRLHSVDLDSFLRPFSPVKGLMIEAHEAFTLHNSHLSTLT
jgi:hypothetical protein